MSTPGASSGVLVVCGLAAEARIARGATARGRDDGAMLVLAGGGDQAKLRRDLAAMAPDARGVISFGVAGGLAPGLRPGDIRVAEAVIAPDGRRFAADRRWALALLRRLADWAEPYTIGASAVQSAVIACADAPVMGVADKAALRARTGGDLVDMESHLAADAAMAAGVAFAALRVVTDAANRALPHAAAVAMRPDGGLDLGALLGSLARSPGQVPGLVRTGLDARRAFASLLRCRQLLGSGFALGDLA